MDKLYLDLETTGLDPNKNSIIEIAATYIYSSGHEEKFQGEAQANLSLVNLDAIKLNNRNLKNLVTDPIYNEIQEKQLIINFFTWLLKLKLNNPYLAGINVHFDFNFLKERAKVYNIEVGSVLPYRLHDIGNIARFLENIGLIKVNSEIKGGTLDKYLKALAVPFEEKALHTAKGDVHLSIVLDKKLEELAKSALCQCNL